MSRNDSFRKGNKNKTNWSSKNSSSSFQGNGRHERQKQNGFEKKYGLSEEMQKDIADVRADYQRDLTALESKLTSKLAVLQTTQNNFLAIQNSLVGDVDNLKVAEDKKLAKRYRTTVAFILTAVGGMILANLPDFIAFCIKLSGGVK